MTIPNANTNERLERQRPLGLTIPRSVAIIGCGGVGSWAAYFLALAGAPLIFLWDSDEVSNHNLNRLPLPPTALFTNKANALRDMLHITVPSCEVLPFSAAWTPELQSTLQPPEWIVAATDTWASRRTIYQWSQRCQFCEHESDSREPCATPRLGHVIRSRYIECGAEGEFGGCTGVPAEFTTELESAPGYASVPVHVGPCVVAASVACYYILHNINPGRRGYRFGWHNDNIELQRS